MRKLNLLLITALASSMVLMFSCQQQEIVDAPTGVEFILAPDLVDVENGRLGQEQPVVGEGMCDLALADYAIIEIDGESYTVDIKLWGDNYKTNLIELMPGNYTVESFVAYDADDNALFATPMMESEFEKFVNVPLPIDFTVENYKKLQYDVEVLCVEEFTPPDFGFAFWDIDLKATKNMCIFFNYCEPDYGHKVATLGAWIYPSEASREEMGEDAVIWSSTADGDFESDQETNELLCLKFPFDPDMELAEQEYFVVLDVNGVEYTATIDLTLVEEYEGSYLHLNENCEGNIYPFENSYNISWEDINDRMADDDIQENDLDYNDFVVNTTVFYNEDGLNFNFDPMARGAGFNHAFRMWLPGTGYTISGDAMDVATTGGNTVVTVYEQTKDAFVLNGGFVNVQCGGTISDGVPKTITIEDAPENFVYWLVNPFTANLNVNGGPDYDLVLGNLFPTSTFTKGGDTFKNGLITPMSWAWPTEGTDIRNIYGDDFETDFVPDSPAADRPGSLLYTECD